MAEIDVLFKKSLVVNEFLVAEGEKLMCIHNFASAVFLHPPYSPDLAPSDYHLFGPFKKPARTPLCQ
jgi:hypothetical protein